MITTAIGATSVTLLWQKLPAYVVGKAGRYPRQNCNPTPIVMHTPTNIACTMMT